MSCYRLSAPLKLAAAISDKLLRGVRPVPLGGTRPPALLTRLPASGCLHSEGRRHEDVCRVYTPRYNTQTFISLPAERHRFARSAREDRYGNSSKLSKHA